MGLTYHFANLDTQEYFDPSIFGGNTKISGLLGDFLSGNALARLLVRDWLESRIAGVSDEGPVEGFEQFLSFDKMKDEYSDISSKVFAMMCEVQTEIVAAQALESFESKEYSLFINVVKYYRSVQASEKFKNYIRTKLGEGLEKKVSEAKKSSQYHGLIFE